MLRTLITVIPFILLMGLSQSDVTNLQKRAEQEQVRLKDIKAPKHNRALPSLKQVTPKTAQPTAMASSGRTYLFISSSVPVATLRNYARDLALTPNASMVMIGFVGGMKQIAPTSQFISSILLKDPLCRKASCPGYNTEVLIDPLLFRKYGITRVPALVYVPEFSKIKPADGSEGLIPQMPPHFAVYGDASLAYMREQVKKESRW